MDRPDEATLATRKLARRTLLRGAGLGALAAAWGPGALAGPRLTPSCADDDEPTLPQTEGPFFKPGSPERLNLREGVDGVRLTLVGTVVDLTCKPVPGALLEFWHADAQGRYDLDGYRLRGHQFTDADGLWLLETIVPRWYGGNGAAREAAPADPDSGAFVRTPHIHAKVQAANGPVLTTQLYFPPELDAYGQDIAQLNAGDLIFDRSLVVRLGSRTGDHYVAQFGFVVG